MVIIDKSGQGRESSRQATTRPLFWNKDNFRAEHLAGETLVMGQPVKGRDDHCLLDDAL